MTQFKLKKEACQKFLADLLNCFACYRWTISFCGVTITTKTTNDDLYLRCFESLDGSNGPAGANNILHVQLGEPVDTNPLRRQQYDNGSTDQEHRPLRAGGDVCVRCQQQPDPTCGSQGTNANKWVQQDGTESNISSWTVW